MTGEGFTTRDSRLVDLIAGARPNFVKIAAIVGALDRHRAAGGTLRFRLIHTGQHYDARMSGEFFEQLGIPEPDLNLEVGSGTQAEQTGAIMLRYERVLADLRPGVTVVVGDVTSTMACAITAQKAHVPVAHVEAGIRSGDWGMPEEINRLVTDSVSNWFFTTSEQANENLRATGVASERLFFVGNTMIDTLLSNTERLRPPEWWEKEGLEVGGYIVLTMHRPANVDGAGPFDRMLHAVAEGAQGLPVVFPVHPRTRKTLVELDILPANILPVDPQPYLEFNFLVRHAKAVVTDSGGITEEATVLGVPCLTLRDNTERPETVTLGTNELIGTDPSAVGPALARVLDGTWKSGSIPPLWDGKTGDRIVAHLDRLLGSSLMMDSRPWG